MIITSNMGGVDGMDQAKSYYEELLRGATEMSDGKPTNIGDIFYSIFLIITNSFILYKKASRF